jgi:hypothetical protein
MTLGLGCPIPNTLLPWTDGVSSAKSGMGAVQAGTPIALTQGRKLKMDVIRTGHFETACGAVTDGRAEGPYGEGGRQ